MHIEIVSIGAELLFGKTINTNATLISGKLLSAGFATKQITTIGDQQEEITAVLNDALTRADVIITTGGLGPTGDDITRQTLCKMFDSEMHLDETIAEDLRRRYGEELTSLKDQATVPTKAQIIPNRLGTAPGFIFEKEGRKIIVLPGVPSQMEMMLLEEVIPFLLKEYDDCDKLTHRSLYFCLLSENQMDPVLRKIVAKHPNLDIGICPSYGTLSVYLNAKKGDELTSQVAKEIEAAFPTYYYSHKDPRIEKALHHLLTKNHKMLALAESCTGGKIASRVTALSGASEYFLGGVTSYSNAMKHKTLGVTEHTLEMHGAVSRETVIEMAQGIQKVSGADYAIAVSGIAGPTGGTQDKPVGTVWGAIVEKGLEPIAGSFMEKGLVHRETVINYATTYLLSSLWRWIHHQIPPFSNE